MPFLLTDKIKRRLYNFPPCARFLNHICRTIAVRFVVILSQRKRTKKAIDIHRNGLFYILNFCGLALQVIHILVKLGH